ncbi:MAG: hypothetical protein JWM91_4719 [Rhodospirillales bacterium]|nr:hypothetical protein [Rhodospirillales bacterium]
MICIDFADELTPWVRTAHPEADTRTKYPKEISHEH